MAIARDDRWLTDAQGRALAGAQVYYCTQPANTSVIPPSPLATIYSNSSGTVETNPQSTDGFGHSVAYLDNSQSYTLVFVHPLFGGSPVVLVDQTNNAGGGGGSAVPFAGVPSGAVDGINRVFSLTNLGIPLTVNPTSVIVWDNFPLIQGLGYTITGTTITFATAPASGDSVFAQGFHP